MRTSNEVCLYQRRTKNSFVEFLGRSLPKTLLGCRLTAVIDLAIELVVNCLKTSTTSTLVLVALATLAYLGTTMSKIKARHPPGVSPRKSLGN